MHNDQQPGSHAQDVAADTMRFPDEIAHLATINGYIAEALADAEAAVAQKDKAYMDAKRYMVEYRGELDPHEMFQNELGLKQLDQSGAFAVEVRDKVALLRESPYFARIDFCRDTANTSDIFYIGRVAFSHHNDLLISDWRSPVAGMFYDYDVGPAAYTAPMGNIAGELTRKRQFKIQNGVMEYALESAVNIQDNILRQELARTSDEKMKSIITTIQKEQNGIIRNETAGTLLIQGVAGSGKTSIALHRIAYLLYRFKDSLKAQNVAIISPNRVFEDYISNVLPELGEEPIHEATLSDIASVQLEGVIGFEVEKDLFQATDAGGAERVRYKSTLEFVGLLDQFIKQIPGLVFAPAGYACGRFTESAERINARFRAYEGFPVKRRLQMIAEDLRERFLAETYMGADEDDIPKSGAIVKALQKMLTVKSTLVLYKEFYRQNGIQKLFAMPAKNTLEWADVYPFLYIHAAFEGLRESGIVKHLVIDEMQDYTPIQYAALNRIFKCPKTIVGDFGQTLHPYHQHTWEDLKTLYGDAECAELSKSYRSTYEIISFAKRVKRAGAIEAVERHGEPPAVIQCRDAQDELARMREGMRKFAESGNASLGIITKTNEDAKRLYDVVSAEHAVHWIAPGSNRFVNGISIASVQMSKGLEFDEVIIPSVNEDTYHTEYDRSLLYIACTRAMHRLTLFHTGEVSSLIG